MSDLLQDEPGDYHRSEKIHVVISSVTERRDFSVGGDCTIRQLKWTLSERLGGSAGQMELIHSGRVLKDSELMSHLKGENGSVGLCMIQRPQPSSAQRVCDPVESELTAVPDPDQNQTQTPTSPLCLVGSFDSLESNPGFFSSVQHEMESQLLGDPEIMHRVLCSSLVQNSLSTSSPQLARHLILSNPRTQQLLQTNPEVEHMLNNKDVINQVLELIRDPDMINEMMQNEDRPLNSLLVEQDNTENATNAPDVNQKTEAKKQSQKKTRPAVTSSVNHLEESIPTPVHSGDNTDPLRGLIAAPRSGMQSVLEEIAASPGLMESLLSGPSISSLLNCLSQNPDLASQMLLSHPMFSGNVQLQQQMKQQIPLFLQQMQSPELLSVMLNPRATEALLQIQQGLQTLAAEAPSLVPLLSTSGASVNPVSDGTPNSQSGCSTQVVTVTEQQQQFVHQMLQALANTNNQLCHEEEESQEELEQLSSTGFRDRRTNL